MKKNILYVTSVVFFSLFISSCSNESEFIAEQNTDSKNIKQTTSVPERTVQNTNSLLRQISSYEGVINSGIKSSIINYPKFSLLRKLPVVIIMHGYFGKKERMQWLGEEIAKRGFITLTVTTNNSTNPFTNPKEWTTNYKGTFETLKKENQRKDSPLFGRFNFNKVSIVGHSMGGGGAFYFSDQTKEKIKSIVALAPYSLTIVKPGKKTTAPTLVIAGGKDPLATKHMTKDIYETLSSKNKDYVFFKKINHMGLGSKIKEHPKAAKKVFNWLKRFGK